MADVQLLKPREVRHPHCAENRARHILAARRPRATGPIERAERTLQPNTAVSRVDDPSIGTNALIAFIFGNALLQSVRLKTRTRTIGRRKTEIVGNLEGLPEATFADSSMMRATCSTT